jgi:hypothetical protein
MPRKEITGETFRTVLINRRKRPVLVYESNSPRPIVQLAPIGQPGAERVVESCDPGTLYSQFDEVIWEADGRVTLKENREFIPVDYGKYPLTISNRAGAEVEQRVIAGRPVFIPRGIPVTLRLSLTDQEVVHRELRIVLEQKMTPSTQVQGIYEFRDEIKDEWLDRPAKELDAIGKALDALADAKVT